MDLARNLICILFFLVCTSRAAHSEQAAGALLHWKSTLDSSSTTNLFSWSPANSTCLWFGILCSSASATSHNIIGLRLPEAGIKGRLETLNFAAFPQLTELNLSRNGLHGAIPASISLLHALVYLDLGFNSFETFIPPELGSLSNLVDLRLSNNNLTGAVPYQLSKLPKIVRLEISQNYLDKPEFSPMPTLQIFSMYSIGVNGSFPQFILECPNLTFLDVSWNKLSGPILELLPKMAPNLTYLKVRSNWFSGPIPPTIATLRQLQYLELSNNNFTGVIPWELGTLAELLVLDLQNNPLNGPIPVELCKLSNLYWLNAAGNNLSGTIPSCISGMAALARLELWNNQLEGLMRVTRNSPHSTLTHMITSSSQLPSSASRISDALRRRVAIRVHNFGRENLSNPTDKCEISGISNKKIPKKYFGRILLETISKTSYIPILCIIIKNCASTWLSTSCAPQWLSPASILAICTPAAAALGGVRLAAVSDGFNRGGFGECGDVTAYLAWLEDAGEAPPG
ncbi:MDIS1-interacting receptor like kinase 2-like [Panicum hallii]|uniref:MDIS1-interacting receptor like kinase 2-like n=1 Tax=Panicum hallii TaxID=206008 RepID=UPI000DF4D348|nr:MDIS1-interacting receptor like kinase 2-like [Panicum hallii]